MVNTIRFPDAAVEEISTLSLEKGAIKLDVQNPFQWASGYFMPIYNDNRLLTHEHPSRKKVVRYLTEGVEYSEFDIIAGTATAGIPWAAWLANEFHSNFIYVRDKPKGHGLRNRIEGIDANKGLEDARVILIEDLVSTGGSSVSAVQAIRDAGGVIENCVSIFNYGFKESYDMFKGEIPFEKNGKKLDSPCQVNSLLRYDSIIYFAGKKGYLGPNDGDSLREWRESPWDWGEKRGFPKVEKKNG